MSGAQAPAAGAGDAGTERPGGGPTISASLENLVAGSQGVIAGRLDLALLEARELVSRSVERAALAGVGMMLAAGAWMAASAAVVVGVAPHLPPALRLAAFAALCALGALAFVGLAMRRVALPPRPAPASAAEAPAAQGPT
ncbi:MAG: phage holin family protein [Candidatus Binatia bacterium]